MTSTTTPQADWRERMRAPARRFVAWALDDSDRMLLYSTESGQARLYAYDRGTQQQVALPAEAKAGYTWLAPDGRFIYFVRDVHDSEVGHLMRMPWEGGEVEAVAPDLPPMYFYGLQVARDGTLYFACSGQGSYRIYRRDADGTHVLYEHRNEAYLPFLSADETLLAFSTSEPANNRHWQATVIAARTGARASQLSDGYEFSVNPGYWLMSSADVRPWSPVAGDQRLLFTSNASGEPKPGIWHVASGERIDLARDLPGEVTPLCWTHEALAVIVQQAHEGRITLHRCEVESGVVTRLHHAPGTLMTLPLFPDGTLLYAYTSLSEPLQTRALKGKSETVILPPAFTAPRQQWESVTFHGCDGTEIHGFLGIPKGSPPFPTILHMHGGPTGQVTDAYTTTWQQLVEAGYLFFTINFRGSTGYGRAFQEQINGEPGKWELADMAAARAYLIERRLARPDRIMLTGGSYGGYLTLMGLTRQPELWRAGFALVPCCNFRMMYEDANQRLKGWARMLLGGTPEERPAQYWDCSPIAQVERLRAPVAIIAHRSDTRCPVRQVEEFIAKLQESGAPHEAEITEGGHGTRSVDEQIHHHEKLLEFAARHLR